MWRKIAAVGAGLVAWIVIVSLLNRGLRLWLPGYSAVEQAMTFTLTMKIARLSIAALSSLAGGAITRAIALSSNWAPWIVGLILTLLFVPEHIHIWSKLPVWYHLTFLLTLAPLVWLGGRLPPGKTAL